MKEFFNDPTVQKWGGWIFAAGFFLLGHYYPDLATEFGLLAGAAGVGPTAYHATAPKDRKPGEP